MLVPVRVRMNVRVMRRVGTELRAWPVLGRADVDGRVVVDADVCWASVTWSSACPKRGCHVPPSFAPHCMLLLIKLAHEGGMHVGARGATRGAGGWLALRQVALWLTDYWAAGRGAVPWRVMWGHRAAWSLPAVTPPPSMNEEASGVLAQQWGP